MTFTKDPNAVLDYSIDWTRWLAGDQIAASEWIVESGLTKMADSKTSTSATVWLSGGTAGQSYIVTNRITTAAGRTEDRSFTIRVEER
jgi:fructosamine-3-kinase